VPTIGGMALAGIVSYRFGGVDGVSIEAEKWAWALEALGFSIRRIAGAPGPGVIEVPGLGIDDERVVDTEMLDQAMDDLDVVIVENLCSLPLNPRAGHAVAAARRGRPTILRHHDLPWHRTDTSDLGPPPDDPSWRHVTINKINVAELAIRGIEATCLYNRFSMDPPAGRRTETREAMGIAEDTVVVLQPTRALARKNVPGGLALAEALGATYWLTAAAEDGYGPALAEVLDGATVPVLRGQGPGTMDDTYAACDLVVLPSTWEGFGNPVIESVTHHRPLALASYPVAAEIVEMGFEFFSPEEPEKIVRYLEDPDPGLLDRNHALARRRFDLADLPGEIGAVLVEMGVMDSGSDTAR